MNRVYFGPGETAVVMPGTARCAKQQLAQSREVVFALHDTFAGYRARFRPRPSLKCAAVRRKWNLSG